MLKYFNLLLLFSLAAVPTALADSLDFSFSFTGTGAATGTVMGEIDGLENNATSAATAVFIDTATNNGGGDKLPYNVLPSAADVVDNSFTVTDGVITAADFEVLTDLGDLSEPDFDYLFLNSSGNQNSLGFYYGAVGNSDGFSGATYTELPSVGATPEPATAGYFLEALAAVALLSWRRFARQPAKLAAPGGRTLSV